MTLVGNSRNAATIEEHIKTEGIPVIIFGAGIVGEALFHACRNVGIKVECFCDNNTNKTKSFVCNSEVIHTSNVKTKYKDAIFLISAGDIKDIVDQLHASGYSKWYAGSLLLREFDAFQYRFSAPMDFVEYAVGTCILCHDSYVNPGKLFLRSVDVIITERCSLKCRDCSNLMQYYKKPRDCDTTELMQSVDMFCAFVDEVNEFRVIGGEPFLNKEFHLVTKRLINEPKVNKIVIYTNGTIIPKEHQIEYLKSDKVLLFITDYGVLSKQLDALTQILLQNNIAFYTRKAQGWTDCAKIMRHGRNIEHQKEIFNSCCAKNLVTLSNGRLYRCPFSANTARLMAVPEWENDYIDLLQESRETIDLLQIKKKIRAFLLEKNFLEICDYCNGRPFGDPEIPPAIQIKKPLVYERRYSGN
jgi:sulfatase maturation enzyme AslB (radical SAM superfamily)